MTGPSGVSASQEMRAIRRGQAEAAVATAEAAAHAARIQLDQLDAAEADRVTWELLLALQPYTISNHRWIFREAHARPALHSRPLVPAQRTAASWIADRRDARRPAAPPATVRRWRA